MHIRERYNIEETLNSFTLYPKRPSLQTSWRFLIGTITVLIVFLFFENYVDEAMRWVIYIFLGYFILHSWYEIQIESKIHYTFNVAENAVYKISPLFSKQKIMKLDEMVIFTHTEMGSWYYAVGASKTQFIKNYRISEGFSSGKKSAERQEAFENFVLQKIDKLIEKRHL